MPFRCAVRLREPAGRDRNRSRFARIIGAPLPGRNRLSAATTSGERKMRQCRLPGGTMPVRRLPVTSRPQDGSRSGKDSRPTMK